MTERDELLSKLRSWNHCWPAPWLERAVAAAADQIERDGREIERLTAENQRLREVLEQISIQKRTDELVTAFDVEFADFEDGYDLCIDRARDALRSTEASHDD